jgi:hypothetical protein
MTRYEHGPIAGWVGYTKGDGWTDFHADDGTTWRWDAATETLAQMSAWLAG